MSQRLVGYFSSGSTPGISSRTPLSARWAQMSEQEKIIEKKRLEVLEKMEAQKSEHSESGDSCKPALVNKFSNDGSFMEQFRKLAQGSKPDTSVSSDTKCSKEENTNENRVQEENKSRYNKDRRDKECERDPQKDWFYDRDRRNRRERDCEERDYDQRSSSRFGRGRSRSPKRRDFYSSNERQDRNRDDRDNKWGSGKNDHLGSRQNSYSPDEQKKRKSRFSPSNSYLNNSSSMNNMPINNKPPFPSNNDLNFSKQVPPQHSAYIRHPNYNSQFNNGPGCNINVPPFFNNGNKNANSEPRPQFGPSGTENFSDPYKSSFRTQDSLVPPAFNSNSYPELLPNNHKNMQFNNANISQNSHKLPFSSKLLPPPEFMQPSVGNLQIPPPNNMPIPPPNMQPRHPNQFDIPPPISYPLHNIPEPKPLDTLSIPPPKPLDTMSIPPPKPLDTLRIPPPAPLDAVKIPPPGPMNLQKIPPPMPICLTQIPKPKDLDLCAIPPPMSGNVLSTDSHRSGTVMEETASQVARYGQEFEAMLIARSSRDSSLWFLRDRNSLEFKRYREMVENSKENNTDNWGSKKNFDSGGEKYEPEFSLRDDSDDESNSRPDHNFVTFEKQKSEFGNKKECNSEDDEQYESRERRRRKRKSRWGNAEDSAPVGAPGVANVTNFGAVVPVIPAPNPTPAPVLPISGEKPQLTRVTRQNPGLVQYALKSFGTTNLSDEDWVKCEDHYKISLLYQEMLVKRRELDNLAAKGQHKYEYDSDEDIDGGTWEHKLRKQEMEATSKWANELTKAAQGKHHIGDFLPPEELKKFMDKYSAVKTGKEPDLSDYKEYKLKEDNIGFKMLQKLGWTEGEGLGADGSGIVNPVNKGASREMNLGLGIDRSDTIDEGDDEFDAYRKRMMLAYRFRPNPLNNPRRPYY